MIRSRGPLAAILLAILAASCAGRPSVTIMVAGDVVATQVMNHTERGPCSVTTGDGPLPPLDPTIVREPTPLAVRVDADSGAQLRGSIYEIDASKPGSPPLFASGPLEEFTLVGSGTYQSRSVVAARTYVVIVDVKHSVLFLHGEVTHGFRVRVEPP